MLWHGIWYVNGMAYVGVVPRKFDNTGPHLFWLGACLTHRNMLLLHCGYRAKFVTVHQMLRAYTGVPKMRVLGTCSLWLRGVADRWPPNGFCATFGCCWKNCMSIDVWKSFKVTERRWKWQNMIRYVRLPILYHFPVKQWSILVKNANFIRSQSVLLVHSEVLIAV